MEALCKRDYRYWFENFGTFKIMKNENPIFLRRRISREKNFKVVATTITKKCNPIILSNEFFKKDLYTNVKAKLKLFFSKFRILWIFYFLARYNFIKDTQSTTKWFDFHISPLCVLRSAKNNDTYLNTRLFPYKTFKNRKLKT